MHAPRRLRQPFAANGSPCAALTFRLELSSDEIRQLGKLLRGAIRSNQKQSEALSLDEIRQLGKLLRGAVNSNQKQSEALISNQKHTEAHRSTQKHTEALGSTQKHSEALRSTRNFCLRQLITHPIRV